MIVLFDGNLMRPRSEIVAGGNRHGDQLNPLNGPTDVIIDHETNSFIIADRDNRKVIRLSRQNNTNGEIIISNIDCCRLTTSKNGSLYVSDWQRNEVRRWKRGEKGKGKIVAGGNGEGDRLNQLNGPTYLFVDEDDSLYITNEKNHRVMKWLKDAKEGIVVAGGNGQGNSLRQMSRPTGVIVDRLGQIYVADFDNNRVMRWCQGAEEGTIVIGGNRKGQLSNQFSGLAGLSFDREGNLYVADWENHRIQKFEIE
jgi:sugar lactone lactonase YvrE